MEELGKKLYKSTALRPFKAAYLGIAALLLVNLVTQTLSDPYFVARFEPTFSGLVRYTGLFPQDFLIYCATILFPAFYYSFFRGIVFCRNGMIINRGLPFFNRSLPYKYIGSYKIIHPKFLMAVKRKDIGEEFVFTVRNMDRAIAILDQRDIPGELGKEHLANTMTVNKKLLIIFVSFGAALFVFQVFGGFARFLR